MQKTGINTHALTDKYARLSGTARGEIREEFAKAFDKSHKYLDAFLQGQNKWTAKRTAVFNELVAAQYAVQFPETQTTETHE